MTIYYRQSGSWILKISDWFFVKDNFCDNIDGPDGPSKQLWKRFPLCPDQRNACYVLQLYRCFVRLFLVILGSLQKEIGTSKLKHKQE